MFVCDFENQVVVAVSLGLSRLLQSLHLNSVTNVAISGPEFRVVFPGRCLLQDEDHSGSRPHSFPGLRHMRSGTSPERFQSGPELAAS